MEGRVLLRTNQSWPARLVATAVGGICIAWAAWAFAQSSVSGAGSSLPEDWSHKHLLYTNPDTHQEAARKGTLALEQWKKKREDPRFASQVARKERFVEAGRHGPFSQKELQWADRHRRDPPETPAPHRDWSNVLGGASGMGHAGTFPAKFQFDINAVPSCANDFIVYTTASAGVAGSGAFASRGGTFSGTPTVGQTVTITHTGSPPLILAATASNGGSNLGRNFQIGATTTITATNLANAIARNGGTAGVSATSSGATVTVRAITAGTTPNVTLAKSLTGFTWAGSTLTGGSGTAGQATIVAFNQLYSSCGTLPTQPLPATYWSYNTGGTADVSPVLSLDGTQVAYVQRSGTAASLVVLKWSGASGTVGAPTTLASTPAASYRACTAPCMTAIAYSGGGNNTNSSPFYDYVNDTLYVGADNGTLHKFTGVFDGTPAEAGAPWPVTVSANNILSSPVYDSVSGLVFVGSASGTASGGQLHSINATTGALVGSARLATNSSAGVRDAPIVDSGAQRVYVFVGSQAGTATSASCSRVPCAASYQFPTNFTANATGTAVQVGRGVTSTTAGIVYSGSFDNAYYASANPASPSGNLYVCGSASGTAQRPTLWRIPITSNAMGTPASGPLLVNANAACSPLTEVLNGANDYLYASVSAGGSKTGCTGACIYVYNLTGLTWNTTANPAAGLAATGGTSGIVVDNISATAGASQIYYSTLANPGNAVQASQAALQ